MNKFIKLITISFGAIILIACSAGGSCNQCVVPSPITVDPVPYPTSPFGPFVPAGSGGGSSSQSGSTSPNLITANLQQIAVPNASSGSTSYIIYNTPPALLAQLEPFKANPESISMFTTVTSGGQQVTVIATPSLTSESIPNVYIIVPINQAAPPYMTSGGSATKNTGSKDYSYVLLFPLNSNSGSSSQNGSGGSAASSYSYYVPLPINTNIIPVYVAATQSTKLNDNLLADQTYYQYSLVNTCTASPGTPTSVSASIYQGKYFVGAGTDNGTVCAGNVASDFSTVTWSNLASSTWTTRYTPRGPVVNMSFPNQSSNNILGFWNINTQTVTGGNTIYRITGQNTGSAQYPSGIQPTSFWNTTINTKQYSPGTGSSLTFSGAPSNGFSMLADQNLNAFIGSADGKIYKLGNGSATWSVTQLSNISGPVSLSPSTNPTGVGVIATGINSATGQVSAFAIQ